MMHELYIASAVLADDRVYSLMLTASDTSLSATTPEYGFIPLCTVKTGYFHGIDYPLCLGHTPFDLINTGLGFVDF